VWDDTEKKIITLKKTEDTEDTEGDFYFEGQGEQMTLGRVYFKGAKGKNTITFECKNYGKSYSFINNY